jgi:2-iminobutanoate/2-iminopropanoate deaminase
MIYVAIPGGRMTKIERITTPYSYSLAVAVGDFIFLGLHRGSGDDFKTQFDNTFKYLQKTLAEFGLTQDLPEMEQQFCNYFENDRFPARMTATTEFIDDDCLLMIEGIAYRKNGE